MTNIDYILLKLAFTQYGQITLAEFIEQIKSNNNVIKKESTKDLSKEYVTIVKKFLDEMNKDEPNIDNIKQHIAKLSCQQYKIYLSLKE